MPGPPKSGEEIFITVCPVRYIANSILLMSPIQVNGNTCKASYSEAFSTLFNTEHNSVCETEWNSRTTLYFLTYLCINQFQCHCSSMLCWPLSALITHPSADTCISVTPADTCTSVSTAQHSLKNIQRVQTPLRLLQCWPVVSENMLHKMPISQW